MEIAMEVKISVKLKPLTVPNYVFTEPSLDADGREIGEQVKYSFSQLSPEVLDELCNHFRDCVFAKAGKEQPAREG